MGEKRTVTGEFKCVERGYIAPVRETPVRDAPGQAEGAERQRLSGSRLIKSACICAAAALMLWGLSKVDADITNTIANGVYEASSSELLEDEELGKLKFVSAESEVMPVEGEVVTTFSMSGRQVEIDGEPSAQVMAVLSGTVALVEGDKLVIQNDNGTRSTYTGVSAEVETGDYIERSQRVGTLSNGALSLETVSGIGYVDPLSLKELTETID